MRRTGEAKTLIDIDESALEQAQKVLGTTTKRDTVNAALREVVALAARRRDLQEFLNGAHADLLDDDVMSRAWLR